MPVSDLLAMCARAAEIFERDTLPVGDDAQTPDDYVQQLSATTGMPHVLVRRNMRKIASVLTEMPTVLRGLTRGLDLSILDAGHGEHAGHAISYYPRTQALGVVLPSNSPGVHSLWVPAIALKTPLVLKPGSAEPWTPFRLIQAFIKAGVPRRGLQLLPGRPRRRRRGGAPQPAAACSSATCRRSAPTKAIRASSCTVPATARC